MDSAAAAVSPSRAKKRERSPGGDDVDSPAKRARSSRQSAAGATPSGESSTEDDEPLPVQPRRRSPSPSSLMGPPPLPATRGVSSASPAGPAVGGAATNAHAHAAAQATLQGLTKTGSMVESRERLELRKLVVTQFSIRNPESVLSLVTAHRAGQNLQGIVLFLFPDGVYYIHDGHHRALALHLCGVTHIEPTQYVTIVSNYTAINNVWFEKNFVTPYDPRIETRLHEFGEFKKEALEMSKTDPAGAEAFIAANRARYVVPRTIRTLAEMAEASGLVARAAAL